ncbi:MAG: copper chaperone PCu(A)C [Anaerolineales bacterium]|nr:copper chaperone PCu(A)C [Anaerolineales bacterium]
MKKLLVIIAVCVLLITACTPKEGIEIRDGWVRMAAQGDNGAVYFTIVNYDADDELIGASVDFAEAVEMHESAMNNDVMEMRMVESVPLPTGEKVEFAPGGLHIMLVNLSRNLEVGETVNVTLHFKNHADVPLTLPVQMGPEHSGHGG